MSDPIHRNKPYEQLNHPLYGAETIATVDLGKIWSDKTSYWIDLYKKQAGPTEFYYVYKHWKFYKKNELIQGETIGSMNSNLGNATQEFLSELALKINNEYEMFHASYGCMDDEDDYISSLADSIKIVCNSPRAQKSINTVKNISISKADRLKAAQEERQKKSKW